MEVNVVAEFVAAHPLYSRSSAEHCSAWVAALAAQGLHTQPGTRTLHQLNLQLRKLCGPQTVQRAVQMHIGELCRRWQALKASESDNCGSDSGSDSDDGNGESAADRKAITAVLLAELRTLRALQWHELHRADVHAALRLAVEEHVRVSCGAEFEEPQLPQLQRWLHGVLAPFALLLLLDGTEPSEHAHGQGQALWASTSHWLLRALSLLRGAELFDIVVDFPDSLCAVREFREAASASNSLGAVGKSFRAALRKRLLHSGASTAQIIDVYVPKNLSLASCPPPLSPCLCLLVLLN